VKSFSKITISFPIFDCISSNISKNILRHFTCVEKKKVPNYYMEMKEPFLFITNKNKKPTILTF